MAMQTVNLDTEYTETYSSNLISILQIEDLPEERSLRVFVQLGNKKDFKYLVDVLIGDLYVSNWTADDITNAIKKRFIK